MVELSGANVVSTYASPPSSHCLPIPADCRALGPHYASLPWHHVRSSELQHTTSNTTVCAQYRAVQYSTVHDSTEQYSTVQYSTVQNNKVLYSKVQYNTVQ